MTDQEDWAYASYHPHPIYHPQPQPPAPVAQWTHVPHGHRTHPGPQIHPPQQHIQHPVHLQRFGGYSSGGMPGEVGDDELQPLKSVDYHHRGPGAPGGKSSSGGGKAAGGRSRSASVLSSRNPNTAGPAGTPEPEASTTSLIFFPSPADPPLQLKNARKSGLLPVPPGSILNVNDLLILHPPSKEESSTESLVFSGHTSKWEMYTCRVCSKTYDGKNARSVARRHLQDKHGVPLSIQARRSRWDADPAKPKSKTEAKERLRKSKRDWASKNRQQSRLEKQHALFLERFGPNGLATSCGMRLIAPKYRESTSSVSGKDKFLNGEFGGIVIPEDILRGVQAIREAENGEPSDAVEGQNQEMVDGSAENRASFAPDATSASTPAIPNSLPPSRPSTPSELPVSALSISPDSTAHRLATLQREYAQHHYHQQFALLSQQEAAALQYEYYAGVPMPMPMTALTLAQAQAQGAQRQILRTFSYGYDGQLQRREHQPRPGRIGSSASASGEMQYIQPPPRQYSLPATAGNLESQPQQRPRVSEDKQADIIYDEPEQVELQAPSAHDAPPLTASSVTEVAAPTPEEWTRSEHWQSEVEADLPEALASTSVDEGAEREEEKCKLEPAHDIERGWEELGWESSDKEEGRSRSAELVTDGDDDKGKAVENAGEGGAERDTEGETASSGDTDVDAAAESLLNLHSTPVRAPEDSPTASVARRENSSRAAPAQLPWSSGMMDAPPLTSAGRPRSFTSGAGAGAGRGVSVGGVGSSANTGSAGRPSRARSFIQPFRDPRPEVTRSLSFEHSPVLDDPFAFGETPERPTSGSAYSAARARSSGAGLTAGRSSRLTEEVEEDVEAEAEGSGSRRPRRGMGLPSPSPLSSGVHRKRKAPPSSPATHHSSTAAITSISSRWDSSAFRTSPRPSSASRPALRPLSTNFSNTSASANGKTVTPSKHMFDTPVRSARTPMVPSSLTRGWLMSSPGGDAAASLGLVPTHLAPATPGLRGIVGADTPVEGRLTEARKRRRGLGV